jgi:uncharacterized damage-inducible protein DinB
MRRRDIETLFAFSYWMKDRVLECAAKLTIAEFTAPSGVTTRDLRGTLVHTLDVESSWRARLRGQPETELQVADYPRAAALIEHWRRDQSEMQTWLSSLDDDALQKVPDIGPKETFPLWYYLLHIHAHTQQQLSDAAVLLTRMRQSPGNIDFLDFADHLHRRTPAD